MSSGRVLGVDACKRGWIAIAVDDAVASAYFAKEIQMLISQAEADGPLAVVAIDMPIGLPDRGHRQADILARAAVGPLWPSVFMAPVRQALLASDHAAASAINRELTGPRSLHTGLRAQIETVPGRAVGAANATSSRRDPSKGLLCPVGREPVDNLEVVMGWRRAQARDARECEL